MQQYNAMLIFNDATFSCLVLYNMCLRKLIAPIWAESVFTKLVAIRVLGLGSDSVIPTPATTAAMITLTLLLATVALTLTMLTIIHRRLCLSHYCPLARSQLQAYWGVPPVLTILARRLPTIPGAIARHLRVLGGDPS